MTKLKNMPNDCILIVCSYLNYTDRMKIKRLKYVKDCNNEFAQFKINDEYNEIKELILKEEQIQFYIYMNQFKLEINGGIFTKFFYNEYSAMLLMIDDLKKEYKDKINKINKKNYNKFYYNYFVKK